MILVDSNVPMHLVGAPHVHKADAQRLLEKLVSEQQRLITDAEVLQEILHRYTAIQRRDAIQPAFNACLASSMRSYPLIGWRWSAPKILYWRTRDCLRVMPSISP